MDARSCAAHRLQCKKVGHSVSAPKPRGQRVLKERYSVLCSLDVGGWPRPFHGRLVLRRTFSFLKMQIGKRRQIQRKIVGFARRNVMDNKAVRRRRNGKERALPYCCSRSDLLC